MLEEVTEKVCIGPCGLSKPLSEFRNKKSGKYGKDSYCTECRRVWQRDRYAANPEPAKERAKKRSIVKAEEIALYHAEWFQSNKEHHSTKKRMLRQSNPEKVNKYNRDRRKKFPEVHRQYGATWRAKFPEKVKAAGRRRYMTKRSAFVPDVVQPSHELVLIRDGSACCWCGVEMDITPWDTKYMGPMPPNLYTIEHLIPIDRGGKDIMENVEAWCWTCNHQKWNLTIQEFIEDIRPPFAERGNAGMDHPLDF